MIAIDFGTSNSSVAVYSEGDIAPRLQLLEYGDPDTYDPIVIPSAICFCENDSCAEASTLYGHEALRHHFDLNHDSRLLHEMKLFFDRSTQHPPTLVKGQLSSGLRDEMGLLTPVPPQYAYSKYSAEVQLTPNSVVPGTAALIKELLVRSDASPNDKLDICLGIPASFQYAGPRRLREAAKRGAFGNKVGYDGIHLYFEPLAAARTYMEIHKGNVLAGCGKTPKTSYFENVASILYSCEAQTNSRRTCSAIYHRNPA